MEGTELGLLSLHLVYSGTEYKEQDREWYFSLGTTLRKVRTGKGAWGWKEGKAYEGWGPLTSWPPPLNMTEILREIMQTTLALDCLSVCGKGKTKKHLSFPSFSFTVSGWSKFVHGALSIYYLSLFDTELFLQQLEQPVSPEP